MFVHKEDWRGLVWRSHHFSNPLSIKPEAHSVETHYCWRCYFWVGSRLTVAPMNAQPLRQVVLSFHVLPAPLHSVNPKSLQGLSRMVLFLHFSPVSKMIVESEDGEVQKNKQKAPTKNLWRKSLSSTSFLRQELTYLSYKCFYNI